MQNSAATRSRYIAVNNLLPAPNARIRNKPRQALIPALTWLHWCLSEINRVRKDMYSDTVNGLVDRPPLELPEPVGAIVHLQEKLFVPVKEYPDVSANTRLIIAISASFICSSVPLKRITASSARTDYFLLLGQPPPQRSVALP